MVLKVQWMDILGNITSNTTKSTMSFKYQGKKRFLRGTSKLHLRNLKPHKADKLLTRLGSLYHSGGASQFMCSGMQKQSALFQEPAQLPPKRCLDHQMNLQPGAGPVNIIPYRYPSIQKDVIELMVQEMLTGGIIRPSHNPFSSPIVLVKKKDNT